eukprot:1161350-Pelagomonas_calceolata.AAC.13
MAGQHRSAHQACSQSEQSQRLQPSSSIEKLASEHRLPCNGVEGCMADWRSKRAYDHYVMRLATHCGCSGCKQHEGACASSDGRCPGPAPLPKK